MSELLKIILSMSITSIVLIPLVWLFKKVFGQFLTKRKSYYVWLVVFFFLVVPFAFFFVQKSSDFLWATPGEFDGLTSMVIGEDGITVGRDTKTIVIRFILNYLWVAWLIVAVIFLVYRIASYRNFKKYVMSGASFLDDPEKLDILSEAMEEVQITTPVEVVVNPIISSPIFFGIRRGTIVLPGTSFSDKELRHIFLHELIHCKRRDMLFVWITQVFTCLYWFNPLMYFMNKQMERDRELACDEGVLACLADDEYLAYGDTLLRSVVKSGKYKESYAAVSLHENAKTLKERLISIAAYKKERASWLAFLCLVGTLCVVGLLADTFQAKVFAYEKDSGIEITRKDTSEKGTFSAIDLQEAEQNVTIKSGDEESFDVRDYDDEAELVVKNGTLTYKKPNPETHADIEITLKKDKVYNGIHVKTSGNTVKISDVQAKKINVEGAGLLNEFDNVKADTLLATTDSANVKIMGGQIKEIVRVQSNRSFVQIGKSHVGNLDLSTFSNAELNETDITGKFAISGGTLLDVQNVTANELELTTKSGGKMGFRNMVVENAAKITNNESALLDFNGVLNGDTVISVVSPFDTKITIQGSMNDYAIKAQASQADTFILNGSPVSYPFESNLAARNKMQITNDSSISNQFKLFFAK
ncbi:MULTISPECIES: M56 family metallopeptidase [unclassified Listeria]|uniref:M56 family metallopeptidase n=1 Tax=unclassified Listeria TaxID=2642072 RepID=UPI000B592BE0|nr:MULTISPECIES: M56 family metallopeptidase [unclassified Listeria]